MKKWILALTILALMLPCALAEELQGEGYAVLDGKLTIRLWESAATGCEWVWEIDDESVLAIDDGESVDADDDTPQHEIDEGVHAWTFAGVGDGETMLTFTYISDGGNDVQERMLCYIVTVDGGVIDEDVLVEDLSEDNALSGDEGAFVLFEGDTGGVELPIQEGMLESEIEDGVLLTSDNGSMTMLIDYQPDDDADELFEQLQDEQSASEVYDDDEAGTRVLASYVDMESDPPCATLVLASPEGTVVYTGYQAPNGGVLHVHTTYLMDAFAGDDEFIDE